jgi:hypothetical protein
VVGLRPSAQDHGDLLEVPPVRRPSEELLGKQRVTKVAPEDLQARECFVVEALFGELPLRWPLASTADKVCDGIEHDSVV